MARVRIGLPSLVFLTAFLGCAAPTSDGSGEDLDGSGGDSGTSSGGTLGSTGGSGAGGTGTGGSGGPGTGGGSPSGGATAAGGSSAGGSSTGGNAAAGGSMGTGGASGSAWASFDSDLEGFSITFEDTTGSADAAAYDGTTGDPSSGSVRLDADIAGPDEKIFFSGYPVSSLDLTGETITARIKLDSGLSSDESCPGGAYVFAKSGDGYDFARGTWTNLNVSDGWVTISMVTGSPDYDEGFDPSDVREIGVAISSGGTCGSSPYGPAVAHVDTITF